jgi:hypothetical protein
MLDDTFYPNCSEVRDLCDLEGYMQEEVKLQKLMSDQREDR